MHLIGILWRNEVSIICKVLSTDHDMLRIPNKFSFIFSICLSHEYVHAKWQPLLLWAISQTQRLICVSTQIGAGNVGSMPKLRTSDTHRKFLIPHLWQLCFLIATSSHAHTISIPHTLLFLQFPCLAHFSSGFYLTADLIHSRTLGPISRLMVCSPHAQSWLHP